MLRSVSGPGLPGDTTHSLHALANSPGSSFTVGRSPNSDLLLEHPDFPFLISRSHAEFTIVDGRLCIVDKGSTNGVYLDRKKLEKAVATEVIEGGRIHFGGTDRIVKDGRPEPNPFVFEVHGIAALLESAHAAAPAPIAQDTQEAGPVRDAGEALPQLVPDPAGAAAQQQQQHHEDPALAGQPLSPQQQVPPREAQLPEEPAAAEVPLVAPAAEQLPVPPALPSPVAAPQGPVDLTSTPENARLRMPAFNGRVNEIVDLTAEEDEDGDSPLSTYALQLGRLPAPATGGSSEHGSRKRKQSAASIALEEEGAGEAAGPAPSAAAAAGLSSRSVLSKLEDEFECVICRDMLVAAHTLVPCGHVFCGQCLMGWLAKNTTCPNCRTQITAAPVPARLINNTADGLEGTLAPEDAAERERRKKQWKEVGDQAVASWQALFTGGSRPNRRRMQHPGTGFFQPLDIQEVLLHFGLPGQGAAQPGQHGEAAAAAAAARAGLFLARGPRRSPRQPAAQAGRQAAAEGRQPDAAAAVAVAVAEAALAPPATGALHVLTRQRVQQMEERLAELQGGRGRRAYPQAEWLRPQAQEALRTRARVQEGASSVPAGVEYGVDYHVGSRATCSGCEVLILPGTLRLQERRRLAPTSPVRTTQFWHIHCFTSWHRLPNALPGMERLIPPDQALMQRNMMMARGR